MFPLSGLLHRGQRRILQAFTDVPHRCQIQQPDAHHPFEHRAVWSGQIFPGNEPVRLFRLKHFCNMSVETKEAGGKGSQCHDHQHNSARIGQLLPGRFTGVCVGQHPDAHQAGRYPEDEGHRRIAHEIKIQHCAGALNQV